MNCTASGSIYFVLTAKGLLSFQKFDKASSRCKPDEVIAAGLVDLYGNRRAQVGQCMDIEAERRSRPVSTINLEEPDGLHRTA
ncbi:MAG: hypothetical protein U0892_15570 [Pirellulales bacterium]